MVSWLVVGVGDITSKRVLPAILAEPRSRLGGIVTRDPAKAEPYGVRSFSDLDSALAGSDATAVYVATPVFLHAPQTIAALRAGRHVLCEKPMALNYAEALAMQRASEDTRYTLGIAYYRRMYPKVDRARQLIEAGRIGRAVAYSGPSSPRGAGARQLIEAGVIGRPVFAEATAHDWFNPLGTSRAWLADPQKSGGGPLRDIGSHRIDLMNYLFGKPINAIGHMSTLVQPLEVEDNATVMIEYEGGVRGVVDVRWHSRVVRDEFRVRGAEVEIDLSPLNGPELVHPGGVERRI